MIGMSIPVDVWRMRNLHTRSSFSRRSISTCIPSISTSLVLLDFWFCLGGFRVPALLYFFEVCDHFLSCFKEFAVMSTSSEKCRFDMQSLFFITQFDAQTLFFSSSNVLLRCELENRVGEETAQRVALLCSASYPEFITFLVSHSSLTE